MHLDAGLAADGGLELMGGGELGAEEEDAAYLGGWLVRLAAAAGSRAGKVELGCAAGCGSAARRWGGKKLQLDGWELAEACSQEHAARAAPAAAGKKAKRRKQPGGYLLDDFKDLDTGE